jgi:hypothetical protein
MQNTPMASNGKSRQFLATIYRIWMMRHVDVPEEIARALAKEIKASSHAGAGRKKTKPKYIPVVAIVNGKSSRTTLVPAGGGRYRLQINTALRKAAHADVGDVIGVELRLDRRSRALPVPPDLQVALKRRAILRKEFERLTPGLRRWYLTWLAQAKSPEARERRLKRAIEVLLERTLLRPRRPARRASR